MGASYVTSSDNLTPIGNWIAERLPHVQRWKRKTWRGWRLFVGPRYTRCIASFEVKAGGYMVAFYPFKYVYWSLELTVLGRRILRRRRLFQRHVERPELRASPAHLMQVHQRMWNEIFAGRTAIQALQKMKDDVPCEP